MKTFITQQSDLNVAGPNIKALDFAHAIQQAIPLDISVVGELKLTIFSNNLTDKRADMITRQLSESIEI